MRVEQHKSITQPSSTQLLWQHSRACCCVSQNCKSAGSRIFFNAVVWSSDVLPCQSRPPTTMLKLLGGSLRAVRPRRVGLASLAPRFMVTDSTPKDRGEAKRTITIPKNWVRAQSSLPASALLHAWSPGSPLCFVQPVSM
jgi:hypothetical protein